MAGRPRSNSGIFNSKSPSPSSSPLIAYRIHGPTAATLQLVGNNQHKHVVEEWEKQLMDVLKAIAPGVKIDGRRNRDIGASFVLSPNSYADEDVRHKIMHEIKERHGTTWTVKAEAPPETRSETTLVIQVDAQSENVPMWTQLVWHTIWGLCLIGIITVVVILYL